MPQLGVPLYPSLLVAADVGLAGVLFLTAPVLGALMAATAVSVAVAAAVRARGHVLFPPRPEAPGNG